MTAPENRARRAGPMHVGLFSPQLPASGVANGIVTYVRYMRDALRAQGHKVAVITMDRMEDSRGDVHHLPSHHTPLHRLRMLRTHVQPTARDLIATTPAFVSALRSARRIERLDVIEAEETFGWVGHGGHAGAKMVMRLHGPHVYGRDAEENDDQRRRGDLREIAEGKAMKRVAALSAPSARLLEATLRHYRLQPRLAEAIPNPIDVVPRDRAWRLADCDPDQILCIGRFDTRKGADLVLQAFQRALERQPTLRLVMVGPDYGLSNPDGGRTRYQDYVQAHIRPEARARIDFRGNLTGEEIAELRRRSAFSVIGSRFENFPYSLAEAMAVGNASIVSDSYGNGEMVIDGETGLVVPVGDVAAMADAMVALRADPDRLAAMSAAAWERCRDWLAPDRIARETVALYRRAGA